MQTATDTTPTAGLPSLLSTAEVLEFLGISRPNLWRLEKRGEFPAAITVGSRSKRWLREDVESYLRDRMAARKKAAA